MTEEIVYHDVTEMALVDVYAFTRPAKKQRVGQIFLHNS